MTEDRRAHERIDFIEEKLLKHLDGHQKLEASVQSIADNTKEIVDIVRGAKGLRAFAVWVSPLALLIGAIWAWIKAH